MKDAGFSLLDVGERANTTEIYVLEVLSGLMVCSQNFAVRFVVAVNLTLYEFVDLAQQT